MNFIFTSLLLIFPQYLFSPDAKKEVDNLHEDSKVYYNSSDYDNVKLLIDSALFKSRKINYAYGEARSLFILGAIASLQNEPEQAVPYLLKALETFGSIGDQKSLVDQAEICVTLGKVFRLHNSLDEAMSFYDQGIEYALKANSTKTIIKLFNNKATLYRKKGEYTKAVDVLLQKLELVSEDNLDAKYKAYNQLGLIYNNMQEYDQALTWYHKIIDMESYTNQSKYKGWAYHNMATTYCEQQNYDEAFQNYKKSLAAIGREGNVKQRFISYHDMAELALLEGQKEDALNYAQKAAALIDQVPKTPENYNLYLILSESIEDSDPVRALFCAKQYISETDSFHLRQKELLEEERKYRVKLAAMTYENQVLTEKYDRRILIGSIIIGISIILMAIGLFKMLQNPMKYRYSVFQRHMKKLRKEEAKRLAQEHKKSTAKHLKALEETRKLLKK